MRTTNETNNGFSLIELLIVLVLALIMSAAAYPAYTEFAVRARRTEAQAALLLLMQQQERYYSQRGSYLAFSADATGDEARAFRWWSGRKASNSAYEVEGKACDGDSIRDCVQLVARPGTARVDPSFRDKACDNLILTSNGLRLATGPSLNCWREAAMEPVIGRRVVQGGRTLLEMLVALLIAAILLCGALPAGHALLQRQQLHAAVTDLHAALDTARTLAIARGSVIVVAPHAGGWERGWTIFADRDGDGKPGPGDETILEQGVLADGIHIQMKFTGSASHGYIAYNPAGRSCRADKSQTARWGTLTVGAGPQQYLVRINMLGRTRVCDPKKDGSACTG